ncbi:SEL1-like repeat protein [Neisseria zalophi]|uniref:Sel1 repeat family protein n=1 Tax=Neisseria zalophi TaxID=640030 RepID=A0A5J6PWR0_9NEIS|nr:sel1 repeat family protein [Neisseria zalophi]QEY27179.1 sel1 repeat family protein [Neisseria zalophi]
MANPISSGSIYMLSEEEIRVLEEKANYGDADAAFRLYQYHMFVSLNQELEYKWLVIAAKHGHAVAQSNLADLFLEDNDKEQATFWAKKAYDNGVELSHDLMDLIK